jgi:hypothetical protein
LESRLSFFHPTLSVLFFGCELRAPMISPTMRRDEGLCTKIPVVSVTVGDALLSVGCCHDETLLPVSTT